MTDTASGDPGGGKPRTRHLRALLTAVALIAAGTGCSILEAPASEDECAWLDRPVASDKDDKPHVAVLIDRTASVRPDPRTPAGAQVPDWTATLLATEPMAIPGLQQAHLSMSGFDGTRTTVGWSTNRAAMPPARGIEARRTDDRVRHERCLRERVGRTAAEPPVTGQSDVLGALTAAREHLGPAGTRSIVVVTDGLANIGCADLHKAGFGDAEEITATVTACRTAGEIPDLAGVHVTMAGIGHTLPGRPVPASAQANWLTALWRELCTAANAASCTVGHATTTAPGAATPAVAPPDAEVTFPAREEKRTQRTTTIVLPSSVLFATDRADISAEARTELEATAKRILELHPVSIEVAGHTDSRGTKDSGERLSRQRAAAVQRVLAELGVTGMTTVGHSDRKPRCTPEYVDGVADHRAMACNRRVEITLTLPGTES